MRIFVYRYISYPDEIAQVITERKVLSTNPNTEHRTFYTTTRYNNPADAQRELSLPSLPTHRIGPIPIDDLTNLTDFRTAIPQHGFAGMGVEVTTNSPVYLFGLWNFSNDKWDL